MRRSGCHPFAETKADDPERVVVSFGPEHAPLGGLHRNYVGGIERGERNVGIENIAKLARALGIRPRDLLP